MTRLTLALALLAIMITPAIVANFDGRWSGSYVCGPNRNNLPAFTWQIPFQIWDGVVSGRKDYMLSDPVMRVAIVFSGQALDNLVVILAEGNGFHSTAIGHSSPLEMKLALPMMGSSEETLRSCQLTLTR
jgi:hypothetical protein